ncbi:MAG: hypothetical protein ABJC19_04360 [Gemmatimonadota bacterium]
MPRLALVSAVVASLLLPACARKVVARSTPASVVGRYDTKVTRVEGNCPLGTQDEATEVTIGSSPGVVELRHGGTTYGGLLQQDGSFQLQERTVTVGGVDYHLTIAGQFRESLLDARVTIAWGLTPACRVVVKWYGARSAR